MRPIKFRAWDKKENKWLFGYEYPNLGGFSLIGETVLMGELNSVSLERWGDIEIMQFTGLKDKKGVEIYEGDILKYKLFSNEEYYIGDVKYSDKSASFYLSRAEQGTFRLIFDRDDFEVIGNIYENNNLLK